MLRFNTEENEKSLTTPDFKHQIYTLKDYSQNNLVVNQNPLISTDLIYSENIQENMASKLEVL